MIRTFITGSEWLYYKLYSGPKTSDRILTEAIKPISEKMLEEKVIDSWFFIRYSDPQMHLRVRFHLTKPCQIDRIIQLVHNTLLPFLEANFIWKIMNDMYTRELERYGDSLIEKTEQLFFHESVMIIGILALIEGDDGENIRWLIGLRAIDETLNSFYYDEYQKQSFIGKLRDSFGEEFNIEKDLKTQLSNKYRFERKTIEKVLNPMNDTNSEMAPIFDLLQIRKNHTASIVAEILNLNNTNSLEVPVEQLINSYLHMMINKLFKSKQRLHELVLYDFLYKYYTSRVAREKQSIKP